MNEPFQFDRRSPVKPSWNTTNMLVRGKLTDRKIAEYEKRGWYSQEFREARRELMAKKTAKTLKREGSFLKDGDRLIYSPQ